MASGSESSFRNSDSETEYSDIVCLDGVESEVLERGKQTLRLCNPGADSDRFKRFI